MLCFFLWLIFVCKFVLVSFLFEPLFEMMAVCLYLGRICHLCCPAKVKSMRIREVVW